MSNMPDSQIRPDPLVFVLVFQLTDGVHGLSGHHDLFVRGNDPNLNRAVVGRDTRLALRVLVASFVEMNTGPFHVPANTFPHATAVFSNASRKHDGIGSAENSHITA